MQDMIGYLDQGEVACVRDISFFSFPFLCRVKWEVGTSFLPTICD